MRKKISRTWVVAGAVALVAGLAGATASTASAAPAPGSPRVAPSTSTPRVAPEDPAVAALASQAHISPAQARIRLAAQATGQRVADRLTKTLGAKFGGAHFDARGRLVVSVTDASAAARARVPGVTVRVVKNSSAQLEAIRTRVQGLAPTGSVASVDVVSNRVSLTVPKTAAGSRAAAAARRVSGSVAVTTTTERFSTLSWTAGGVAIYHVGGGRCSSGFNVRLNAAPSNKYTLTAGHCTALGGNWQNWDGGTLGPVAGSVFPGRDFGAIYQTGASVPALPGVYLYNGYYQPVYWAANPYVGQYLCRSGSTTGVHCGYVTATNATVTYPQGTVYGTIRTSICAEPGDSGGSLFSGGYGYGMTSGGSGNCSTGGTTFFQPLVYALSYWGLQLKTDVS